MKMQTANPQKSPLKSLAVLLLSTLLILPGIAGAGFSIITTLENTALKPTAGLFDLYQLNRSEKIPNHITADFLLVAYSLIRARSADQFETESLIPAFSEWLQQLNKALPNDTTPASAANKQLTSVLLALLSGKAAPGNADAAKEYTLITKAEGIMRSPLLHRTIDYSQFRPSGRHAETEQGQQFFRSFRYASNILFPLLESKATGVTAAQADLLFQQASQIATLYRQHAELRQAYEKLILLLNARFGASDDLDWALLENPPSPPPATDTAALRSKLFKDASSQNTQPKVNAEIVDKSQLESGRSVADVITGWRLLPAFATPISSAFQALVFDGTGVYQGAADKKPVTLGIVNGKPVKAFPRALEILSLLGNKQANKTINRDGDAAYEGYDQAFGHARKRLADASGLARHYLTLMQALSKHAAREQSALGFWTWQRYLDQLYVKQSTTPTGKGLNLAPARPGASLESVPEIYRMLATMVAAEQQLYPAKAWTSFAEIIERIQALHWKQSLDKQFSNTDERFLNQLDTQLLTLTGGPEQPIAVAVHSNPTSNERLWEATGGTRIVNQGKARGALLSHHEFKLPMDQPFDNKAWRAKLASQKISAK